MAELKPGVAQFLQETAQVLQESAEAQAQEPVSAQAEESVPAQARELVLPQAEEPAPVWAQAAAQVETPIQTQDRVPTPAPPTSASTEALPDRPSRSSSRSGTGSRSADRAGSADLAGHPGLPVADPARSSTEPRPGSSMERPQSPSTEVAVGPSAEPPLSPSAVALPDSDSEWEPDSDLDSEPEFELKPELEPEPEPEPESPAVSQGSARQLFPIHGPDGAVVGLSHGEPLSGRVLELPPEPPFVILVPSTDKLDWRGWEELIQAVAASPHLPDREADPGRRLALLYPDAGRGSLAVERVLAMRTGRTVVVDIGRAWLQPMSRPGAYRVAGPGGRDPRTGKPASRVTVHPPASGGGWQSGDYVPFTLEQARAEEDVMLPTVEGWAVRVGDLAQFPLVDKASTLPVGNVVAPVRDYATSLLLGGVHADADSYEIVTSTDAHPPIQPGQSDAEHLASRALGHLPMPSDLQGPRYLAVAHGDDSGFSIGLKTGAEPMVSGAVHGQRLARRPSIQALPDDGWLFAYSCAPGPEQMQQLAQTNPRLRAAGADVPVVVTAGLLPSIRFFGLEERAPGQPGRIVRYRARDDRPNQPNLLFRQVTDPTLRQYTDVLPSADGAVLVPGAFSDDFEYAVGALRVEGRWMEPAALAAWITARSDWAADGSTRVVLLAGGDGRGIGRFARVLAAELDKVVGAEEPRVAVLSAEDSVLHGTDNRIVAGRPRLGDGSGTLSMLSLSGDGWLAHWADGMSTELDADLAVALRRHGVELRPASTAPDLPTLWNPVREYLRVPESLNGLAGVVLRGGVAFYGPYDPRPQTYLDDGALQRVRDRLGLFDAYVVRVGRFGREESGLPAVFDTTGTVFHHQDGRPHAFVPLIWKTGWQEYRPLVVVYPSPNVDGLVLSWLQMRADELHRPVYFVITETRMSEEVRLPRSSFLMGQRMELFTAGPVREARHTVAVSGSFVLRINPAGVTRGAALPEHTGLTRWEVPEGFAWVDSSLPDEAVVSDDYPQLVPPAPIATPSSLASLASLDSLDSLGSLDSIDPLDLLDSFGTGATDRALPTLGRRLDGPPPMIETAAGGALDRLPTIDGVLHGQDDGLPDWFPRPTAGSGRADRAGEVLAEPAEVLAEPVMEPSVTLGSVASKVRAPDLASVHPASSTATAPPTPPQGQGSGQGSAAEFFPIHGPGGVVVGLSYGVPFTGKVLGLPAEPVFVILLPGSRRLDWREWEEVIEGVSTSPHLPDPSSDLGQRLALLYPGAGRGSLAVERVLAARTGRTVVVDLGRAALEPIPGRPGDFRIAGPGGKAPRDKVRTSRITVRPPDPDPDGEWQHGDYVPFTLEQARAEEDVMLPTTDGSAIRVGDLAQFPIVDKGTTLPVGSAVAQPGDRAMVRMLPGVHADADFYLGMGDRNQRPPDPGPLRDAYMARVVADEHPMPAGWQGSRYLAIAHADEDGFELARETGPVVRVDGAAQGQRIARRPSVRALPEDGWLFAFSCTSGPDHLQQFAEANPELRVLGADVPIEVVANGPLRTKAYFGLPERAPGEPGRIVRYRAQDGGRALPNVLFRQVTDPTLRQYTDVLPAADGAVLVPGTFAVRPGYPVGALRVDGRWMNPAAVAAWITARQDWAADGSTRVVLLAGGDGKGIGRFARVLAADLDKAIGAEEPRVTVLSAEDSVLHGTDNRIVAGRASFGDRGGALSMVNISDDGWMAHRADGTSTELDADLAVALRGQGVELRPESTAPDLPTLWNEVREYVLVPESLGELDRVGLRGGGAFFGPHDPRDGRSRSWWDDDALERVRDRLGISDAYVVRVSRRERTSSGVPAFYDIVGEAFRHQGRKRYGFTPVLSKMGWKAHEPLVIVYPSPDLDRLVFAWAGRRADELHRPVYVTIAETRELEEFHVPRSVVLDGQVELFTDGSVRENRNSVTVPGTSVVRVNPKGAARGAALPERTGLTRYEVPAGFGLVDSTLPDHMPVSNDYPRPGPPRSRAKRAAPRVTGIVPGPSSTDQPLANSLGPSLDRLPSIEEVVRGRSLDRLPSIDEVISGRPSDRLPSIEEVISGRPSDRLPSIEQVISGRSLDRLPSIEEVMYGRGEPADSDPAALTDSLEEMADESDPVGEVEFPFSYGARVDEYLRGLGPFEASLSEAAVPEAALSETALSEMALPDTAMPDTTFPETAAVFETVASLETAAVSETRTVDPVGAGVEALGLVPEREVDAPAEERSEPPAERSEPEPEPELQPQPEPTPAAEPRPIEAPWYTSGGALGDFTVESIRIGDAADVAAAVVNRLGARPPTMSFYTYGEVKGAVRKAVSALINEAAAHDPEGDEAKETWERNLRFGRFATADGHVVWIRPVPVDFAHVPEPELEEGAPPPPRSYKVSFAGVNTSTGISRTRQALMAETALETTVNAVSAAMTSLTPLAPDVNIGTAGGASREDHRLVVSGRKIMSASGAEFAVGLRFEVVVDGVSWRQDYVLGDALNLKTPIEQSRQLPNRPDLGTAPAHRMEGGHRAVPQHLLLSAIDPGPVINALTVNLLEARLPAAASVTVVEDLMRQMLSETSMRNMHRWHTTSGAESNAMKVTTSSFGSFRGSFRTTIEFSALENITDPATAVEVPGDKRKNKVRFRDDLGIGASHMRTRENSSMLGLGLTFDFGGLHALSLGTKALGYLILRGGRAWERVHTSLSEWTAMNKTTLMRDTLMERYRAGVRVVITPESSTHRIAPVTADTIAEVDVAQADADVFEKTMLGEVVTERLRPVDGDPAQEGRIERLNNVRTLIHASYRFGVRPELDHTEPIARMLPGARHPSEPLFLASRRGQGFGMLAKLNGAERVYSEIVAFIDYTAATQRGAFVRFLQALGGAKLPPDLSRAHRELSARTGVPALEGDAAVTESGIYQTFSIEGTRYDVAVEPVIGPLVGHETFDMTVNARATVGSSVGAARANNREDTLGIQGSLRLKLLELIRLELGNFGIAGALSKNRSVGLHSGSKTYRRTETEGEVAANTYAAVYKVKVRVGGPKKGVLTTWYVWGDDVTATYVIPKQHQPVLSLTGHQLLLPAPRVNNPPQPEGAALDLSGGTEGLYPVFPVMKELSEEGARVYFALKGETPPAERWDWPQAIVDTANPTHFQAEFDALISPYGLTKVLPDEDGWHQAMRYELAVYNAVHEQEHTEDTGGDVELEWLGQSQTTLTVATAKGKAVKSSAAFGPVAEFTPGESADETARKATAQFAFNLEGNATYSREESEALKDGSIDITRVTYSGRMHKYHGDAYIKVTALRWKDGGGSSAEKVAKRERAESGAVLLQQGLEFELPEVRAQDLGLPLTHEPVAAVTEVVEPVESVAAVTEVVERVEVVEPVETVEVTTGTETAGAVELAEPVAPVAQVAPAESAESAEPAVLTEEVALTEEIAPAEPEVPVKVVTMAEPELTISMSHPERLGAVQVVGAIQRTLRKHGLISPKTESFPHSHPDPLDLYITQRFAEDRLRNDFVNLRRTGSLGWFPLPERFGVNRHVWFVVKGDMGEIEGSRPRSDAKLTIRSEGLSEREAAELESFSAGLLGHVEGYGTVNGDVRLGAGAAAGYQVASRASESKTEGTKDIFRVGTQDKAHEFTNPMLYSVEVAVTTEPPEVARRLLMLAKKSMFGIADLLGEFGVEGDAVRELWYKSRVMHWRELVDSKPVGDGSLTEPLSGFVKLLSPKHLVVEADKHVAMPKADYGRNPRWVRGPVAEGATRPSPLLSEEAFERLVDAIHPNAAPMTTAIHHWAPLATVAEHRRGTGEPDTAHAPVVPELAMDTLPGLGMSFKTSEAVLRSHIVQLLKHQYTITSRGESVVPKVNVVRATRINTTTFKARRYKQVETTPGAEKEQGGGLAWDVQFIVAGVDGEDVIEPSPGLAGEQLTEHISGAEIGEVDETDKEAKRLYHYYRFDVETELQGPGGALRIDLPGGFYGMMPAQDGLILEREAPDVFVLSEQQLLLEAMRTPLPEASAEEDGLLEEVEPVTDTVHDSEVVPAQDVPIVEREALPQVFVVPEQQELLEAMRTPLPEASPEEDGLVEVAEPVTDAAKDATTADTRDVPAVTLETAAAPVVESEAPDVETEAAAVEAVASVVETEAAANVIVAPEGRGLRPAATGDGVSDLFNTATGAVVDSGVASAHDGGRLRLTDPGNAAVFREYDSDASLRAEAVAFADAGQTFVARIDYGNGRPRTALVTGAAENGGFTEAEWSYRPKLGGRGFRLSEPGDGRTFEFDAGKTLIRVTGAAPQAVALEPAPAPAADADAISRAHLRALRSDQDMLGFMRDIVEGSFTGKKGYGGYIRPEFSAAQRRRLFDGTATFKQHAANLRDAIGVNGPMTVYRAVKLDGMARAAAKFDEILPFSTSHSLDAVMDWIRSNGERAADYAVFKIAVPQAHTKVALSYPAQHTAVAGEPVGLNQGQLEVVLSPSRLEFKESRSLDGIQVIEVEAHELGLSEVENLIGYTGPVMSLDDVYGRIKDFHGAESIRAAYPGALGDASISVHDEENGSTRVVTASRAGTGRPPAITVTVSRNVGAADSADKAAADSVTVVYDADGMEPVTRTIGAGDVNPLVDALLDGTLGETVRFRELPVPAGWSDPPRLDTPVPAGRRLSIAPVVTEIPIDVTELARDAGLEVRLDELRRVPAPPLSAEVFASLAADLGPAISRRLSSGAAGHTRAVISVSVDSTIFDMQLAQAIVTHSGQQVVMTVSGVQIAELCPPADRR